MESKKIKILIRIGSLRTGGAEKVLIYLLNNINYQKYEIDLLLNIKHGIYINQIHKKITLKYIGIGSEYIPNNWILQNLNKIRNLFLEQFYKKFPIFLYSYKLKNKKYDIELGFIQGFAEALSKSPIKKSKKINWIHSDILKSEAKNDLLNFGEKLDKIIAVSQNSLNSILKLNPNLKNKSSYIYNPIDVQDIINQATLSFQTDLPKNPNKLPVLISVGTIYPIKGFDRLIKSHAKLKNEGIFTQLFIVGAPLKKEYLKDLKNLCSELNVEDYVFFFGFQKNPYQFINYADIFVCSSHIEGFSLVVAEAMVLDKPIVSTNVTGPDELLNNNEFGILTENSEEGLFLGLKKMIQNPNLQIEYKEKLKNNKFNFEADLFIKKIENLFDSL